MWETRLRQADLVSACLVLCLAIAFFCVRAWHGIWFMSFVDESEHLVGGMMLDRGSILYRTFDDAHGPVIFMLTQASGAIFGWSDPNLARSISVGMAAVASLAVATSPPASIYGRLWTAAIFVWLITTVWIVQALYMVNYHEVAGCLLAAALAVFLLPSWRQAGCERWRAVCAGACLSLVVCTAYSFLPGAALLVISALWSAHRQSRAQDVRGLFAGGCLGLAAVALWMLRFGDFTGYAALHFAANQFDYARYTSFGFGNFLTGLVPSAKPAMLVHGVALICCALAFAMLLLLDRARARPSRSMAGPIVVGFLGLLALNARGGTLFQDGSFVVSAFACFAIGAAALIDRLILAQSIQRRRGVRIVVPAVLLVCLVGAEACMRRAANTPFSFSRAQLVRVPVVHLGISQDPESRRIRALTAPTDRILALPYAPHVFLFSGRMPMDKYTVYLPWDADYAKAPWFGVARDLCKDMASTPPKLVYFDHWIVWNKWPMEAYAPCFTRLLQTDYTRQADFPNLYVRNQ